MPEAKRLQAEGSSDSWTIRSQIGVGYVTGWGVTKLQEAFVGA